MNTDRHRMLMQKSNIKNPKFETRNSKQYLNSNSPMFGSTELAEVQTSLGFVIWSIKYCLEFGNYDFGFVLKDGY